MYPTRWNGIAERRIINILTKSRVSTNRHLEIKISEAGPSNLRVEPAILSGVLKKLVKSETISVRPDSKGQNLFVPPDFGQAGDQSRFDAFCNWHESFTYYAQREEFCGMVLERVVSESLDLDDYNILGSGPLYNDSDVLYKPPGAEQLYLNNKAIYKAESGSGFDLLAYHKDSGIHVGVECKNIRQWIYPASVEVWRTIARACTLDCLPVLISRKISFLTRANLFSQFGILGFSSQFQYFANSVNAHSKYKFKRDITNKDRLGFADIKLVKPSDTTPDHIKNFFKNTIPENIEDYYEKFQQRKWLLEKYAIDKGMAEYGMSQSERYFLYEQFRKEAEYDDIWGDLDDDEPDEDDFEDIFEN